MIPEFPWVEFKMILRWMAAAVPILVVVEAARTVIGYFVERLLSTWFPRRHQDRAAEKRLEKAATALEEAAAHNGFVLAEAVKNLQSSFECHYATERRDRATGS